MSSDHHYLPSASADERAGELVFERKRVELARALLPHLEALRAAAEAIVDLEAKAVSSACDAIAVHGIAAYCGVKPLTFDVNGGSIEEQMEQFPGEAVYGPGFIDVLSTATASLREAQECIIDAAREQQQQQQQQQQ
jgi:hypothetical protein